MEPEHDLAVKSILEQNKYEVTPSTEMNAHHVKKTKQKSHGSTLYSPEIENEIFPYIEKALFENPVIATNGKIEIKNKRLEFKWPKAVKYLLALKITTIKPII